MTNNPNDPRSRDHGQRGSQRGSQRPPDPEILTINPARLGLPSGPQEDVERIADCLLRARSYSNVLAPAMQITELPVDHKITFMVVLFPIDGINTYKDRDDRNVAGKDQSNSIWYATDGGELALHRAALDMLAQAAGITWVHNKCGRTDDRTRVALWSYRMTLAIKGLDGMTREVSREYELDLRSEGDSMSPAAAKAAGRYGVNGTALRNARINGPQLCESKAANRAVRAALGLRAYTVDEAQRPFVIPVLRWVPDASDPVIRRMVAAKEMGIVAEMYGGNLDGGSVHLVDADRTIDHDPRPAREARLLPAPEDGPDLAAELQEQQRRNATRQPVPRGQAGAKQQASGTAPWEQAPYGDPPANRDPNLLPYCEAKGWHPPNSPQSWDALLTHVKGRGRDDYANYLRSLRGGQ